MSRAILVVAALAVALASASAHAVVPLAATYDARITGTVSEWNILAGGYQVTGTVDLPALLLVEQRRSGPRPDAPVIGLFTDRLTALDTRPGAINFGTNSQAFHVIPSATAPTLAAIDAAVVQANVAAGTVAAGVEELAARSVQLNMFRTSAAFASAPAQILAGTLNLQFGADGRAFTGNLDLGGNGLIEPGNPLFRVRRYTATLAGTARGAVTLVPQQGDVQGGDGGGVGGPVAALRRLRAPRGGLAAARSRGIAVALDCAAACRAQALLRVSRAAMREAGLRRRVVGSADAAREDAGPLALRVRVTRRARRRLAALDAVALTALVSVTGAGEPRAFRRTFTLTTG